MGQLLTGQAALPNKIGTGNINTSKLLNNTFESQGFKPTPNTLSNISKLASDNAASAVRLGGGGVFNEIVDEIILQDKSGYLVQDGFGRSAWVEFGTSYNEVATSLGALSNKKFFWKTAETVVNTLDLVVAGGAGSAAVRVGKTISLTSKQAKAAALGARIAFGTFNYRYNYGLDWSDAGITATTSNINLFTAYRVTDLLPKNKLTHYIGHTSHNAYEYIENMNLFGKSSKISLTNFTAMMVDGKGVNFSGTIPKGGRWNDRAFSLTISPDKFYNRGVYELNKEMGFTPYNIFKGKFGLSDKVYYSRKFANNKDIFDDAVASVDGGTPPTDKDYYKKVYGEKFMDVTKFFGQLEQASDPNAALDIYFDEKERAENEGLNAAGRFLAFMPNASNLLENQRLRNQYSIMEINNMQKTLIKAGVHNPLFTFEQAAGATLLYTAANIGLKAGSLGLNIANQIVEPIASIGSSVLIRAQQTVANTINAVANMFGVGVKPKPKAKKPEAAKVSHTVVIKPLSYTYPNPGSDMISLDKKYIQRNIPLVKEGKQWEKQEATLYLNNKRAEILAKLKKEQDDFSPSIIGTNKKGRVPTPSDITNIKNLQQQYIGISNYIDRIGGAIDKGLIKYDYKTNTFNNKKIW
jgi:hypothetical protein